MLQTLLDYLATTDVGRGLDASIADKLNPYLEESIGFGPPSSPPNISLNKINDFKTQLPFFCQKNIFYTIKPPSPYFCWLGAL